MQTENDHSETALLGRQRTMPPVVGSCSTGKVLTMDCAIAIFSTFEGWSLLQKQTTTFNVSDN